MEKQCAAQTKVGGAEKEKEGVRDTSEYSKDRKKKGCGRLPRN